MLSMTIKLYIYNLKQSPADFMKILWNLEISIKKTLV